MIPTTLTKPIEQGELVERLLERHGSFAVTMLRAMCLGMERNPRMLWEKEDSDRAEKDFAQALAEDRAALLATRSDHIGEE